MADDLATTIQQPATTPATTPASQPATAATSPSTTATPAIQASNTVLNAPVEGDSGSVDFSAFEAIRDASAPLVEPVKPASVPVADVAKSATTTTTAPNGTPSNVAAKTPEPEEPLLKYTLDGEPVTTDNKPVVTPPAAKIVEGRDMAGLDDAEVEHFRKMGNEAFNAIKPAYLEYKALKVKLPSVEAELNTTKEQLAKAPKFNGQLPDSYHEHPAAFVLDPNYLQAQSTLQNLGLEEQHWVAQAEKLAKGEKPKDLVQGQDGRLYEGQELPATAHTQAMLTQKIAQVAMYKQQWAQQANALQQQHQVRYNTEMANLQAFEAKTFPWFKPDAKGQYPYKDYIESQIKQMPAVIQSNPVVARLFAKSLALFADMNKQIKRLSATKAAPTPTTDLQPLATTAGGGSPNAGGKAEDVGFDEFEKLKQQY